MSSLCFNPRPRAGGVGNIRANWGVSINNPIHPHGCGEHHSRAWGVCPGWRFIPTGVGNIADSWAKGVFIAVHPHGHGEHKTSRTYYTHCHGHRGSAGVCPVSIHVPARVAWGTRFIALQIGSRDSSPLNWQQPFLPDCLFIKRENIEPIIVYIIKEVLMSASTMSHPNIKHAIVSDPEGVNITLPLTAMSVLTATSYTVSSFPARQLWGSIPSAFLFTAYLLAGLLNLVRPHIKNDIPIPK